MELETQQGGECKIDEDLESTFYTTLLRCATPMGTAEFNATQQLGTKQEIAEKWG